MSLKQARARRAGKPAAPASARPGPARGKNRAELALPSALGLLAVRLLTWARETAAKGLVHVAASERRAERLANMLRGLDPKLEVLLFPPWDCLPYDRAPPSRDAMGRRMSVLARLCGPAKSRIVVTVPEALIQRVPPREAVAAAGLTLEVGQGLDVEELQAALERLGYVADARVDEPGEFALLGRVFDIFPPGARSPFRLEHSDGVLQAIRCYRAQDQLTFGEVRRLQVDAASEVIVRPGADAARDPGCEHWLPQFYPRLATLFDYLPDAAFTLEPSAEPRRKHALEQIADAYAARLDLQRRRQHRGARAPVPPQTLFLDEEEALTAKRRVITLVGNAGDKAKDVPLFAAERKPTQAFGSFLKEMLAQRHRIVLAAASDRDLNAMVRRADQATACAPQPVSDWASVRKAKPGALLALRAELGPGFIDEESRTAVVTAADLFGSRAELDGDEHDAPGAHPLSGQLTLGDTVIHLDYGLGLLSGLEAISSAKGAANEEAVRLSYRDGASVVVPVADMDHIWRYGSDPETATLDRLNGQAWPKRRQEILGDIARAARALMETARARRRARAPKLVWPSRDYERVAQRFPFAETPDQARAIEDSLNDLASGRPMNRLVCGDVGYGKTEVALRAAAAAAFAGKQVAVLAPTTVLVRQHLETFRKRFAGTGIEVGHLSRLVAPAEARRVKKAFADGTLSIVIGTQALAAKGVRFRDLGLVVIDEEQRFGTAQKVKFQRLARGVHLLTLTATPIPRTLQSALAGLVDLSLLQTPPVRRRPIRTFLLPFDPVTVREALLREERRGGQCFVVCPRIEDIDGLRQKLSTLVPDLEVAVAHGKMPADELDGAMVRFAQGEGDVLLATNIIESGLDIPRANTILIWRADRFGLSQLHQLRGRVGRGRARGIAYLLTDPERKVSQASLKRLKTIEELDRLGAGFEISRRDLDIRGAGDLLGAEQAGHVKLIGGELYQYLLCRALKTARGEAAHGDWSPEMNIGVTGSIPADYVPDVEVRLNLYARLARLAGDEPIDAFAEELEDRFGPPPQAVRDLVQMARVRQLCQTLGVMRIDAGPKAIALAFRDAGAGRRLANGLEWRNGRLLSSDSAEDPSARLRILSELLEELADSSKSSG